MNPSFFRTHTHLSIHFFMSSSSSLSSHSGESQPPAEILDQHFRSEFVEFDYPGFWTIDEQDGEGQKTISLQTSETGFWSITLLFDRLPTEDVLAAACEAFKSDYESVDIEDIECEIVAEETTAKRLEFFCHDLVSQAELTCFRTGRMTVLLLTQAFDKEWETVAPIFRLITQSVVCPFGDETLID